MKNKTKNLSTWLHAKVNISVLMLCVNNGSRTKPLGNHDPVTDSVASLWRWRLRKKSMYLLNNLQLYRFAFLKDELKLVKNVMKKNYSPNNINITGTAP